MRIRYIDLYPSDRVLPRIVVPVDSCSVKILHQGSWYIWRLSPTHVDDLSHRRWFALWYDFVEMLYA